MFTTVCVGNGIGIALMIMLLITNREHFNKEKRARYLLGIVCVTLASCMADILAFAFDGRPGAWVTVLLYAVNSWLFFAVVLVACFWVRLEFDFIGATATKAERGIHGIIDIAALLILVINLFYPLVFSIEDNVYRREGFYWIFVLIGAGNIAFGLVKYNSSLKKGKFLVPFSAGLFAIPIIAGVIVQSLFYGISVVWVGVAIAIASVASSLKNSLIFIDSLTRVYGPNYLEKVAKEFENKDNPELTGILVDINDFKRINDTFGHDIGDDALLAATGIFCAAVKSCGAVIRSGGDEFLLLIDSKDQAAVSAIMKNIDLGCTGFNRKNKSPYRLSVSMGSCVYDRGQSFDEFLKTLDTLMYENKQAYHRLNDPVDAQLLKKLGAVPLSPDILRKAKIGLWAFELDEGCAPRMYADKTMLGLIGLKEPLPPEETYHAWYDRIDEKAYEMVADAVEKMTAGEHAEVQYPWHHPDGYTMVVRCGGVRNPEYKGGIRIEGTHQNVSQVVHFDEEAHQRQTARELELTHAEFRASALGYLNENDGDVASYLNFFAARLCDLIKCDQVIYRDSEGDIFVHNSPALDKDYEISSAVCRDCAFYDMHAPVWAKGVAEMQDNQQGLDGVLPNAACPVKSSLARIVYLDGKVNGYLTIHYLLDYHEFTDYERQTLEEFANLLSLSLSRHAARIKREELEHHLANQQRQMKSFGDMVNAALWSVGINDSNEVVDVYWSEEFKRMLGFEETDDFPQSVESWSSRLHPDDKADTLARFRRSTESRNYTDFVYDADYRLIHKTGDVRWYHTAARMQDGGDGIRHLNGIMYDISADKQLEEQQLQLENALSAAESANREKLEFLFSISNELRIPINALIGFSALAKEHINDEEVLLDCLNKTQQSNYLLLSLIDSSLDISRMESGRVIFDENVGDVRLCFASVEDTMKDFAATKDVALSFEVGRVIDRYVYCDFDACNRIFVNVISNAINFSRKGGSIRVKCEQLGEARDGRGQYRFTFADRGLCLTENARQHLTDYLTQKQQSVFSGKREFGLGLTACKLFVDFMGGAIAYQSSPEEGTVFTIELPFRIQEGKLFTDPCTMEEKAAPGTVQELDA